MSKKDIGALAKQSSSGDVGQALRSRFATPTRINLDELSANPRNLRHSTDDPDIQGLAETLRQRGQLQPAVVVKRDAYLAAYPDEEAEQLEAQLDPPDAGFVVITGNRRLAASRLAGLPTLDVRVVSTLTDAAAIEDTVLIENIQRSAIPPLLEAQALKARVDEEEASFRSVGAAIGKSHMYVKQRVALLDLIPELQAALEQKQLTIKSARDLGLLSTEEQLAIWQAGPPFVAPTPSSTSRRAVNPVYSDTPATETPATISGAAPKRVKQPKGEAAAQPAVPTAVVSSLLAEALGQLDLADPQDQANQLAEVREHIDTARKLLAELAN